MEKITSAANPAVRRLKALNDAKTRRREGRCLVEGEVMIKEALDSGLTPAEALFTEQTPLMEKLLSLGCEVRLCSESALKSACDTVSPQGCCASFSFDGAGRIPPDAGRLVALDGVQDPGNLGTILRTMDAAGFQGAYLSEQCADVYSPKVQRSAMGSAFRVPTQRADLPEKLSELKRNGFRLVLSLLDGKELYDCDFSREDRIVLVVGNEAAGISEAVRRLGDTAVRIPMRGRAESLNAAVAAGILMYELTRPGRGS